MTPHCPRRARPNGQRAASALGLAYAYACRWRHADDVRCSGPQTQNTNNCCGYLHCTAVSRFSHTQYAYTVDRIPSGRRRASAAGTVIMVCTAEADAFEYVSLHAVLHAIKYALIPMPCQYMFMHSCLSRSLLLSTAGSNVKWHIAGQSRSWCNGRRCAATGDLRPVFDLGQLVNIVLIVRNMHEEGLTLHGVGSTCMRMRIMATKRWTGTPRRHWEGEMAGGWQDGGTVLCATSVREIFFPSAGAGASASSVVVSSLLNLADRSAASAANGERRIAMHGDSSGCCLSTDDVLHRLACHCPTSSSIGRSHPRPCSVRAVPGCCLGRAAITVGAALIRRLDI